MPALVLAALRCPICTQEFAPTEAGLRCLSGHPFDRARQGYVNLLGDARGLQGDDAPMVEARERFLGGGHFGPLADCLAQEAQSHAPKEGLIVEVGAGTGYYVATLLERLTAHAGLALDLSKYAARRAARAHPRLASVIADVNRLPLADASVDLLLDVFAPRNAGEFQRVLSPQGILLLAVPTSRHLGELRERMGLLGIDPDKEQRLADALSPHFQSLGVTPLEWRMELGHSDVLDLVSMGPTARHVSPETLRERVAELPETMTVTASVRIEVLQPKPSSQAPEI